ncbi:alcohol dehydrogenase [Sulfolobus sp. A20]|uniref:alcohol dehydrogenase catalytic domain-containing protein n=1 Tax=Sulfolobaceae TaxID=118883 RepID=UPI0008462048|nr:MULTISPECIES: alcohol dehydrogenase catalytic domain-containing protein [unclassified Sulfolobus]TRM74782.1 alcohol dehydrogenase [Sulfolobus sp. B5]TRM75862.1 alcohol dehydrogenase [Sulfolobus sp. E5]TRM78390.1 alcohol dehydrogenase [Sulfolobus sp. A20-N-F8]TRM83645.1 alcohol dehydrogenase [Sulfolobus sp. A20-N-F6]TRM89098.1 alcohol dehydrogenase [Sulfolobus sp. C3]TRN02636.1 alcohol dehydrogenase [Sulfolobus sp. E1]TRN04188.1 alcohol dehydrogenase [Sulfolobus sp. F1]
MKAALFKEYGIPLNIENVAEPKDGIILRVLGTGLCHGDVHLIFGDWKYDIKINTPRILGHEIIGEVVSGNTKSLERGDMVLVYNAVGCMNCKYCKIGHYQYCENVNIIGLHLDGGYAEYVKVPSERNLLKVEGNPIELAPLADAGITAYNSVKGISEDDNVLLVGTSYVSLLALQILKNRRTKVAVVGRNLSKLSKFKEIGADEIIPLKSNSVGQAVGEISSLYKFDYIIDYVGNNTTLTDLPWLLRNEGELRIVGEFGGVLNIPEQLLVLRGIKVKGILYGTYDDLLGVYELYSKKVIKTFPIPYSLNEINQAINDVANGKIFGRAIIIP